MGCGPGPMGAGLGLGTGVEVEAGDEVVALRLGSSATGPIWRQRARRGRRAGRRPSPRRVAVLSYEVVI